MWDDRGYINVDFYFKGGICWINIWKRDENLGILNIGFILLIFIFRISCYKYYMSIVNFKYLYKDKVVLKK